MSMDHTICPGSKMLRQPKPETIKCASCGTEVEIWSDEMRATCPQCKRTILREGMMSCLDWCKMGKECVGSEIFDRYMKNRAVSIRQQVMAEVALFFGADQKNVTRAEKVLGFAEELLKQEGGDWNIVVPASLLHDVDRPAAGPAPQTEVVQKILLKIGLRKQDIQEICAVLEHRLPSQIETLNEKLLHDAVCLADFQEAWQAKKTGADVLVPVNALLTGTGRALAQGLLLG